jgi:hypothetical protein
MLVLILVFSALISWPMSHLVNKVGLQRSFWWSFILISAGIASAFFLHGTAALVLMMVLFSITFTSLSVSSLPLAIRCSNYYEKVFCVGLFFAGAAVPNGILEAILAW